MNGDMELILQKGVYPCEPSTVMNASTRQSYHRRRLSIVNWLEIWWTDVLLLADVFKKFKDTSVQHNNLDPAHYFLLPRMSWDGLLKTTKIELKLLTDIDMHLFIK